VSEGDIRNAARQGLPEAKLKLTNLEIANGLARVAALACPEAEAAEILDISPVGVSDRVAEGADWIVGEEAAAFVRQA